MDSAKFRDTARSTLHLAFKRMVTPASITPFVLLHCAMAVHQGITVPSCQLLFSHQMIPLRCLFPPSFLLFLYFPSLLSRLLFPCHPFCLPPLLSSPPVFSLLLSL